MYNKLINLKENQVIHFNLNGIDAVVEKIKVLGEEYIAVGFIGADTGKIYNIDFVKCCKIDFLNQFKKDFNINLEDLYYNLNKD